ncbi:MAG: 16S rRNA (uracil(1498)-N(3))-methyltransferase [Blautia sp.]|nr:16S rRNA (uracil(1498)-N(3))-methyltransferase [Blautia sp.]
MQQFFVSPAQIDMEGHSVSVTGADLNHMKNALRLKPGEEVWISDGAGKEYHCEIEAYTSDASVLHILYVQEPKAELASKIYLFQALPKSDKMEFVIQKAVELGAFSIVPVKTKRCVVRLDKDKAQKKSIRWQQISESAAKQSHRLFVPEVSVPLEFDQALRMAKEVSEIVLIPYELETDLDKTRKLISSICPGQSVSVFIGPEGGFAEEEVSLAVQEGAVPISLGRRILRTETAGMMILAVLGYFLEA